MQICKMCTSSVAKLELSHIIPKHVTRHINKYLKGNNKFVLSMSNEREQDGYKIPLLCKKCELIFSKNGETPFANNIFIPYLNTSRQLLEYDKWLNFFIASLAWRILYVDLQNSILFEGRNSNKEKETISIMNSLKEYLLKDGDGLHPFFIQNHVFQLNLSSFKDIAEYYPVSLIKGSSISFVIHTNQCFYIFSSFAGLCILTVIRQHIGDVFENTIIREGFGNLNLGIGQTVKSEIIFNRLQHEIIKTQTRVDYKAYKIRDKIAIELFNLNYNQPWKLFDYLDIDEALMQKGLPPKFSKKRALHEMTE
jgi:hypothetical protein